ncbi:MAG: right-handed parallel beta-helix repeat-containing protein [Candidatus Heimdallarchaeaceae archaeon]
MLSLNSTSVSKKTIASEKMRGPKIPIMESLTPHGYILITSDSQFGPSGYNFPGLGTQGDPYRIENLNITISGETGILIRYTSVYFIIQNCYIDARSSGISLISVGTNKSVVQNNVIGGHRSNGITLYNAPETTIRNNTVYDCENLGILLQLSANSIVEDNKCYNCGFFFSENSLADYLSYTTKNNWVNNKVYGFVRNAINTDFFSPSYGQLLFVNCTNVGVYTASFYNASIGFMAVFSNEIIIDDSSLYNNSLYGVYYYNTNDSKIVGNFLMQNDYGTYAYECQNIEISQNTIYENREGIYCEYITTLLIKDNVLYENHWDGMMIYTSSAVTCQNNEISNSYYTALYVDESYDVTTKDNYFHNINESAIYYYYANTSVITQNKVEECQIGLYTEYFDNANVTYNLFKNNLGEGVYLDSGSSNISVFLNTFYHNNGNLSQAYDDGIDNIFYDEVSQTGNWWSDYSGTGNYSIAGSAGSFDLYPLNNPPVEIAEYSLFALSLSIILLFSLVTSVLLYRRKR